jgi:hypothetical protein
MRFNTLMSIAAASAVIALAGCSANSTSAIAPSPNSAGQAHTSRSTSVLPPAIQRMPMVRTSDAKLSFNTCPSTGTLIYAADFALSVVNIYNSSLTMCGQLTGLTNPQGMTVFHGDLLVANTDAGNVLRYHRGAATPFKTYTDPSGQFPVGVAVLRDRTVVGSNIFSSTGGGSLSTWHPNGTFVGNFVPPGMSESFFVAATDNGTIFSDGFDTSGFSAFWTMTCPAGACAGMTEIGEAMTFPGGVTDTKSGDVLASDQLSNTADTFEMPSLTPVTFSWNAGGDTDGIDGTEVFGNPVSQVYGADAANNAVNCFSYKQSGHSTGTCGTAPGNSGGQLVGIAVDPGS